MIQRNKTKLNLRFYGIIPALVSLIIFGLITIIFSLSLGFIVLGCVVIFYSFFLLYASIRSKHFMSFISTIYMVLLGLVYISFYDIDIFSHNYNVSKESKVLIFVLFVFMIWIFIAMMLKKLK